MIPGIELVGKNASLHDGVYNDDYMTALNDMASVDDVFGRHKQDIAEGKNAVGWLVMDTLGKSEYENHLVSIVKKAAKAGKWVAVLREQYKHTDGLSVVEGKNFGYVAEHEGQKFLLPSAHYLTHCKARLEAMVKQ